MPDELALASKVAIVTGAASGMGAVMARALAAAGATVAPLDINRNGLDELVADQVFAGRAQPLVTDVAKASGCRRAVADVVKHYGRLDILVNCAGISMAVASPDHEPRVPFFVADPEAWQRILVTNCLGAVFMARFAVEPMLERGWGRIIKVTTSFDTMLAAGLSAYGASKAALEAVSSSFAKDLEGSGVTVNVLVPGGPTDTPGFFPPGKPRPAALLDPAIMAAPAVWLASTQSDGISGRRFIARDWDAKLPASEAARRAMATAAWPELAQAASAARGYAM